ncbi:MAG: single-stranded-DNA-specific exonuclease [Anaerolineaceae bacterium]|nr:MAG: single-stranded-DNA-specific exonuclease [Anaerolineaceae bacterium]
MTQRTRWLVSPPLTPQANENLAEFPPLMRQLLFNRGYATAAEARAFVEGRVTFDTAPSQMKGMDATVARIRAALERREPIAVYGDYDVDGVTATALLVQALQALGADARPYIPNRFEEGYGLNNEALDLLAKDGVKLVISVDCGIRSPEEARHARTVGLDLIITDHHEPAGELPDACAVVNPKQEGDAYPEKYLAGVGIAYKIAQALMADERPKTNDGVPSSVVRPSSDFLDSLLDLVALGTVADLAPLTGENRLLVRAGLCQMRQTRRQGLFSLANVSGVPVASITAMHIGFLLGPRLNAAGRLDSATAAYDLLTAADLKIAGELAQKLDGQNRERQALTRKIQAEAEAMALADDPDALLMFAVSPDFNSGVVGLAAARLVETYYRPAIVGQQNGETTRCSCRSIPEFHITHALDQCTDLLVRHGGHAAAAGFTVRNENLEALKARLKAVAAEQLAGLDLRPTFTADAEAPLADLKHDLLKQLEQLQPTGYGNPEAVFVTRGAVVKSARTVGADAKHLKLTLSDGRYTFDAIGFRLGPRLDSLPGRLDVLYTFEANEYNGRVSLQLNLKDIKSAGTPD